MRKFLASVLLVNLALYTSVAFGQATLLNAGDAVIQGSLGIGLDVTTFENFGSNTLILKENNLRIKFDDNSDNSAGTSFPSSNWILLANESANGGENHFAIVE